MRSKFKTHGARASLVVTALTGILALQRPHNRDGVCTFDLAVDGRE